MTLPSSPGSASVVLRREARFLRASSAGVASKRGELRARRPSSRGLWPGEATLMAATVLWLLVLVYMGAHAWGAMVNDSRSDVGAYGDN